MTGPRRPAGPARDVATTSGGVVAGMLAGIALAVQVETPMAKAAAFIGLTFAGTFIGWRESRRVGDSQHWQADEKRQHLAGYGPKDPRPDEHVNVSDLHLGKPARPAGRRRGAA